MSLRARIALTFIVLETILVATVLYVTLTHSMQSVSQQVENSQQVTIDLLGDLSKAALITEEFAELQAFIKGTERDPKIRAVIISDIEGLVVAATDEALIGLLPPAFSDTSQRYWRRIMVHGSRSLLGGLAIEFSTAPLQSAFEKTRNLGIAVAVLGSVLIALVAWLIGHILTRRLWRLAVAADKIACGEHDVGVFLPGNDEVARVGRAFNSMVARLRNNMRALEASRDRLIKPTEAISEGFALWSADDRLILCNRPFRELFARMEPRIEVGMSHEGFAERLENHLAGEVEQGTYENRAAAGDAPDEAPGMVQTRECKLASGRWISLCEFRTPDGELVGIYSDITERKATEATIRFQATHDTLTGLPNRLLFRQRLETALEAAKAENKNVAVAFLDLDRFKLVNDGLGHNIGDDLLIAVAGRLQNAIGERDMVARMGGDEFILLLWDVGEAVQVQPKASDILTTLKAPYHVSGHELHVSASLGLSLFSDGGRNADQLLKAADVALYRAKAAGRGRWQLDNAVGEQAAFEQIVLEAHLRRAIEQGDFSLVYQPQINLRSGRIIGVEALLRWHHAEWGSVPPDQFIPLAEESGMINELGLWALSAAMNQHRRWRDQGIPDLRLAINISPLQLKRPGFECALIGLIQDADMPLHQLELELTESALMQEGETTKLLQRLATKGVSVALDDFGTGYSSLSYLRRFPIDRIKIDRSFVCDISGSQSDGALARAVIMLAHGLNIGVIAEGVETAAQLSLLRHFGCDEAQGYLLGTPVPGEDIAELMLNRHRPAPDLALAAV